MATTIRARRAAYDNISVGNATGTERTTRSGAVAAEKVGGLDNIAVGQAFPTSVIADNQQVAVVTMAGEKVQNQ